MIKIHQAWKPDVPLDESGFQLKKVDFYRDKRRLVHVRMRQTNLQDESLKLQDVLHEQTQRNLIKLLCESTMPRPAWTTGPAGQKVYTPYPEFPDSYIGRAYKDSVNVIARLRIRPDGGFPHSYKLREMAMALLECADEMDGIVWADSEPT